MKNVLFIAYEFPPLNSGGVHRSLAFVKYLKQFGINPVVITLSQRSYGYVFENPVVDETLGKDVLSTIDIFEIDSDNIISTHRSRIQSFFGIYFSIMGREAGGWKTNFKNKIDNIVKEFQPQAVFVTVPPFSILELAAWVSKKFRLPLITDFRDAWSQWRLIPYGSYLHYKLALKAEKKYLKYADAVIATSNQTLVDFKQLHPGLEEDKFHLITNGFDDEIDNWTVILPKKDNYTIGYVGSFYYEPKASNLMFIPWWKKKFHRKLQYIPKKQDWLYRSPYFFLKSVRKLFDEHEEYKEILKIRFAGKKNNWLESMIEDFKLEQNVELIGVLSHSSSLAFQQSCDSLLITSSKLIGGSDYSIAGKTFEYFKLQKPIISFVCDGAQKDILEKSGLALICDPDNTEVSSNNIKNLFEHKIHLKPNNDFLRGLSRHKLTKQLARIINDVID